MRNSLFLAMAIGIAAVGCSKSDTEKKCDSVWDKEVASAPKEMRGLIEAMKGPTMSVCKKLPLDQIDCLSESYARTNSQKCADVNKQLEKAIAAR